MLVHEWLENSAQLFPCKTALVIGTRRLTYSEVNRAANGFALRLNKAGIRRGDRVAVWLENSLSAAIAIFGILKAGAVFSVLHPTTKADKVAFVVNNCRARVLITDSRKADLFSTSGASCPSLLAIWAEGDAARDSNIIAPLGDLMASLLEQNEVPNECIDVDLAALIYTSGSTGHPKGVMITHLNIVSAATSITTYLNNRSDDVILSVLPLSFDYGLYQWLMTVKIGGTLVLEQSFAFPHRVLERLIAERATGFPIVPPMAAILLEMQMEKYDLRSLRYVTNTAQALPVAHILRLMDRLPNVRLFSMYGLTECKRVSYLPPDQLRERPTSVGRGMPNEEVYIVDDAGNRVAPGVTGELVVRGSNVMRGYWEMPQETARVLRPGPIPGELALYTGDLFRADEEGFLYFVGRKDDIIKTQGEKVSPREVEDVVSSLPGVAECAVVGVPDPVIGTAIKVFVRLHEGQELSAKDVLWYCREHLEQYSVPKHVEFRTELPRTSSGKVSKTELTSIGQTYATGATS